jgi:5-formyltetrahydrofolate cyclo-ligase
MSKTALREELKKIRFGISPERRREAALALHELLSLKLHPYKTVLSFVSKGSEIDLSLVNAELFNQNRLFVPEISGTDLNFGCSLEKIECILVPGLGFDREKNRLGYGKGYYDRFFSKLNKNSYFPQKIGVGFSEQFTSYIPTDAHDVPLDEIILV